MQPQPLEVRAYSITQFCQTHGLGRSTLYKLIKEGRGPRVMKVGTRTLISAEAAAEWRRLHEVSQSPSSTSEHGNVTGRAP